LIVYVNDESSADKIKVKIDNLDKGETCEGILCDSEGVHVHEISRTLSLSSAQQESGKFVLSILMLAIMMLSLFLILE